MLIMMLISGSFVYGANNETIEKALETSSKETIQNDFKVVGYYSGDLFNESVEKLQTNKLTHIMYAFLIPNDDGTVKPLAKPEQLKAVVDKAHQDGAKVYIALGGWSYQGKPIVGTFEKIGADDKLRTKLIESVVKFVNENNLDGAEIDWEHPNAASIGNYEKLVIGLSKALKKEGKNLTAAVNGAWSTTAGPEVSKLMTDNCLNSFEFICVMGYDMNNQEHSPLWFGNTSINYWLARGVEPEKIVLGMPLYGRPSWLQYRDLVALDPANAYQDSAATKPNASYYNGLNTLREKTRLALEKAGGVMLFDINEDVDFRSTELGKYSVVSMIDDTIESVKGLTRQEIKNHVTIIVYNDVLQMIKEEGFGMPFIDRNSRTMVPMGKLLETMDVDLIWNNNTKTVTATKRMPANNEYPLGKAIVVTATIGDRFIFINGQRKDMDTQAIIQDGRIYLPARTILEAFGYTMQWSGVSKTAYAN